MRAKANSIGLIVLDGIALICAAVVAATGHTVAQELWTIIYVLTGAAAGVTLPAATASPAIVSAPPTPVAPSMVTTGVAG